MALGDIAIGAGGTLTVLATTALTIAAARRGQRAQAKLAEAQAIKAEADTNINLGDAMARAEVRLDRERKLKRLAQDQYDVVWEFARSAITIMRKCAARHPELRAEIDTLLRASTEADRLAGLVRVELQADDEKSEEGHDDI